MQVKYAYEKYKQHYIAWSANCSTKPLSTLLTVILSALKNGHQSYWETSHSRIGVNQMWILWNSKDLLVCLKSRSLSPCNNIKTFDFFTLYSTIPHSKLKEKLRTLIHLCLVKKDGKSRYKYLVLGREKFYILLFTNLILTKNTLMTADAEC